MNREKSKSSKNSSGAQIPSNQTSGSALPSNLNRSSKMSDLKSQISQMIDDLDASSEIKPVSPTKIVVSSKSPLKPSSGRSPRGKKRKRSGSPPKRSNSPPKRSNSPPKSATTPSKPPMSPFNAKTSPIHSNMPISPEHKGEFFVLKRNYEALMATLLEKDDAIHKQRLKISQLTDEVQEGKVNAEIVVEDLKLRNNELRQKLRKCEAAQGVEEIVQVYEEEISKLLKRNKSLRSDVVEYIKSIEEYEIAENDVSYHHAGQNLLGQMKKLQNTLTKTEKQLADLKREQRHWNFGKSKLNELNNQNEVLAKRVVNQQKGLVNRSMELADQEGEVKTLRERNNELEHEIVEVVTDNEALIKELAFMRELAASNGVTPETVQRLHKTAARSPSKSKRFALSLLTRLRNDVTSDKKVLNQVNNVIEEVEEVYDNYDALYLREQNLLNLMADENMTGKKFNKELRKNLLTSLTS